MAARAAPAGVRYRYRGKFISAGKAARYANLKNVQKYITTQFMDATGKGPVRKEYFPPVEKVLQRAIRASRKEAKLKAQTRARTGKEARQIIKRKMKHEKETVELRDTARMIVDEAEEEDISLEEAMDRIGYDPDALPDYSPADVLSFTDAYYDEGEEFFEFSLMDLEEETDEDRYE